MALPRDSKGNVLLVPVLAGIFGFTTQLPNPVFVNLTTKFGMQLSVPITLYVLWRFWARIPVQVWKTYALLVLPLFASMVASSGLVSDFSVIWKYAVFTGISFVPLLAAGFLANEGTAAFLKGTAWAVLLNVGVGLLQVLGGLGILSFAPFYALYNNGEYATDAQTIPILLRSVRPFGLFPEPSAMAACLSPFLILFVGYSIGLIRFPGRFDRSCRRLILIAAITGSVFVVISRSGASIFLALAIAFLFVARAGRERDRTRRAVWAAPSVLFLVFASTSVIVGRLTGGNDALNGSWAIRIGSISQALQDYANAGPAILIFGWGGLAEPHIAAETNFGGIFSVLVSYFVNGGAIAALCIWRICVEIGAQFRAVSSPAVTIACVVVYVAGICFATSYLTPAPLYTTLAVFLLCIVSLYEPMTENQRLVRQARRADSLLGS